MEINFAPVTTAEVADQMWHEVDQISVMFVASKDEPVGIADDYFLSAILGNRLSWVLWDDMPVGWDVIADTSKSPIVVIRSLWEGRDHCGATSQLSHFLDKASFVSPYMKVFVCAILISIFSLPEQGIRWIMNC